MTSCCCVSAPRQQRAFVTRNLATAVLDVVTGGGRAYVLTLVDGRDVDMRLTDPFDGTL